MPPRKSTTATEGDAARGVRSPPTKDTPYTNPYPRNSAGKVPTTPRYPTPNHLSNRPLLSPTSQLLLLTQGRYVKTDEYEQLSSAFPGTTTGSIRNRISALRVKQRDMYEEAGWMLPEGGALKKPSMPAKRKKTALEDGADAETPTKKGRGEKKAGAAKKSEVGVMRRRRVERFRAWVWGLRRRMLRMRSR